jgi:hypothetical protein
VTGDEQRLALSRLLASTARAHHDATGGRSATWPRWYAEHLHDRLSDILSTTPDVDTLAAWLTAADRRYRQESPDGSWPSAYAAWIIEWAEVSSG